MWQNLALKKASECIPQLLQLLGIDFGMIDLQFQHFASPFWFRARPRAVWRPGEDHALSQSAFI
jgi:hypothetical protein